MKQWDSDPLSLAYDPVSGDTHLLDALLVELLTLVGGETGGRTVAELVHDLADVFAGQDAQQAQQSVNGGLATLEEMGLVEQKPR